MVSESCVVIVGRGIGESTIVGEFRVLITSLHVALFIGWSWVMSTRSFGR